MSETKLKRTPLYSSHLQLGARMVPFAGYEMPVQYAGVIDETKRVRRSGGFFDVSHMGQVAVRGKQSLAAVQSLVTNDLSKLGIGQAQYNMLCNPRGGVIDDLLVYRRSEDFTYICVNASNREQDVEWMQQHLPKTVTLTDESDETSLIAVQGPQAETLLKAVGDVGILKSLRYYWAAEWSAFGLNCYLSRTGYTGEDGFEIYIANENAPTLWTRLLELGSKLDFAPIGLGARDTLRTEMGYALHGHELSESISPLSAGLGWVVKLNQSADFIGKAALQQEFAAGTPKMLHAFLVEDRRIPRAGYPIKTADGKALVGEISSGTFSPHLNKPIAMGFVTKGTQGPLAVEVREDLVPLIAAKLPFVPSRVKK